jgi:hypothetical protein
MSGRPVRLLKDARDAQHRNSLPGSLVGRTVASACLEGGVLAVIFEA